MMRFKSFLYNRPTAAAVVPSASLLQHHTACKTVLTSQGFVYTVKAP